jgi:hypothetical protein
MVPQPGPLVIGRQSVRIVGEWHGAAESGENAGPEGVRRNDARRFGRTSSHSTASGSGQGNAGSAGKKIFPERTPCFGEDSSAARERARWCLTEPAASTECRTVARGREWRSEATWNRTGCPSEPNT